MGRYIKLVIVLSVLGIASLGIAGKGCPWTNKTEETIIAGSSAPLPSAVTGLQATVISFVQIDLTWNDNSNNEDGIKIERKTGITGTYTEIGIVGANITSYSDTDVTHSTTYYYRVRAYNTIGYSMYATEVSVTTPTKPFALWGGDSDDKAYSLVVDSSGNIYVTGYTTSFGTGDEDAFLVKYDLSGTILWQRTWGGSGQDRAYSIAINSSGSNIYVTGLTASFVVGSTYDAFLLKYNSDGALLWQRTWGESDSATYAYEVAVDALGNIYVTGGKSGGLGAGYYDAFLLKYNDSGTLLWQKTWGETGWDHAHAVAVDSADNIYVAGNTKSFGVGEEDVFLLKYEPISGTLQWQKTWGGNDHDRASSVTVDPSSGNIYLVGVTHGFGAGSGDVFLLNYEPISGTLQWKRTWGGTGNEGGGAHRASVAVDSSSGNIYVAGGTRSFSTPYEEVFLLKYDSTGTLLEQKVWGEGINGKIGRVDSVAVYGSNVFLAGQTNGYTSQWRDVSGTVTIPVGTVTTPTGTVTSPSGTEAIPTGTETTPSGIETGAGGSDVLLLRITK